MPLVRWNYTKLTSKLASAGALLSYTGNQLKSLINETISLDDTYIHNWPLQRFRQDYDLASHTANVVCVNSFNK